MVGDRPGYRITAQLSVLLLVLIPLLISASIVYANPFEPVASDHWSYDGLERLAQRGLVKGYVEDRLRLGYTPTYFDVALWVGEALDRLRAGGAPVQERTAPLARLVAAYNENSVNSGLTPDDEKLLNDLIALVTGELEVLGYTIPPDVASDPDRGTTLTGIAKAFEGVRMGGESGIYYSDARAVGTPPVEVEDGVEGSSLRQSYTLRLSGPVSREMNVGAFVEGENRRWATEGDAFRLRAGEVDVGISRAAVARFGPVSDRGFSAIAVGEAENLSRLQAGVHVGQLGSSLLVATFRLPLSEDDGESGDKGVVTAWDGSLQVTERLNIGATLASLNKEMFSGTESKDNTVVSLGGTYAVTPELILSGEMAQSSSDEGGAGALKVGAVLHPFPELTVGALVLSTDSGYRRLFSQDDEKMSRFDLSAEVGRWILSLRRQHVFRQVEDGANDEILEQPADDDPLANRDVTTTELDLQVRYDKGKLSLGYVLEGVQDSEGLVSNSPVRTAKASLEHAVGPIGKALAGFSIVDQVQGSVTTSNVGLSYDFDDASVALEYKILAESGDVQGMTTAEVSIEF